MRRSHDSGRGRHDQASKTSEGEPRCGGLCCVGVALARTRAAPDRREIARCLYRKCPGENAPRQHRDRHVVSDTANAVQPVEHLDLDAVFE